MSLQICPILGAFIRNKFLWIYFRFVSVFINLSDKILEYFPSLIYLIYIFNVTAKLENDELDKKIKRQKLVILPFEFGIRQLMNENLFCILISNISRYGRIINIGIICLNLAYHRSRVNN